MTTRDVDWGLYRYLNTPKIVVHCATKGQDNKCDKFIVRTSNSALYYVGVLYLHDDIFLADLVGCERQKFG